MIKQLKRKVHLIITLSLSVIILAVTLFYIFSTYNSTIRSSGAMVERFMGERHDDFPDKQGKEKPDDLPKEVNEETVSVEGVYRFFVSDGEIIENVNNADEEILNLAQKVADKKSENGIVGQYIFRKIQDDKRDGNTEITLIESSTTINALNRNIIIIAIIGALSVVAIYFLSLKITKSIVKPVEETFDKQKQFISDASHELKTPLAVIKANAGVLEGEIGENKWINYINCETESMDKLVNDLLLLAKSEKSENDEISVFDISKQVQMVAAGFEGMAYEKGISIKCSTENDISFKGNADDIKHILSTLLDNAIKHTKDESKVWVSLNKLKNEYVIKVKNRGDPIPEEDIDKIFERFYRVDKARNREEKRYGLGLAIAKQTAEKYRGNISVKCFDGYTEFTVKLYSK